MEPIIFTLLVIAGPLVSGFVVSLNAKKLNAEWRARRDAKLVARAEALHASASS